MLSTQRLFSESDKTALIENIRKLKLAQVKEICKSLGLPLKGNKGDLLGRLLQYIDARAVVHLAAPELLAILTLVLKLLFNSPLPNYQQLVNAIRSGAVSESSVASLLENFLSAANLTPLAVRPQLPPSSKSSGNLPVGQHGGFNSQRAAMMNSAHPLMMGGINPMAALGNLNVMASMNRSIGGMAGLNVHGNPMGQMSPAIGQVSQIGATLGHVNMANRLSDPDTYTGPMLQFKSTLFYILRRLISSAQVLRISKGRNVKTFRMKLHSSDVKILRDNPNARVYLFCGTETTTDTTNTPIQFPPIEIYVDDVLTKQFTKGIKGKPGSARPADLTPYFALFEKPILVRIVYSDALEKFILYTYIVDEVPLEKLVEQISRKAHIPTMATRAQIQKQNEVSEDDCDIVVATSSLTLRCPLTYARMKLPVRSIECDHIQCFDCESFLSMQQKIPLWQCPVCSKYVDQNLLAISDYLQEIISETTDSVDSVILNADGSWKAVEEAESLPDSDDDEGPGPTATATTNGNMTKPSEDPIEIISLDSDSEPEGETVQPQAQLAPIILAQGEQQVSRQQVSRDQPSQQVSHQARSTLAAGQKDSEGNVVLSGQVTNVMLPSLSSTRSAVSDVVAQEPTAQLNGQLADNGSQSESPLSAVSAISSNEGISTLLKAAQSPLLKGDQSDPSGDVNGAADGEDEDEDIVTRPRRRAVITDNSDTENSRPSSAFTSNSVKTNGIASRRRGSTVVTDSDTEESGPSNVVAPSTTAESDNMEEDTTFHSGKSVTSMSPDSDGDHEETALAKLSRPKRKVSPESITQVNRETVSQPKEAPEEAQFLKGMRSLSSLAPNVDPFAPSNKGQASYTSTENSTNGTAQANENSAATTEDPKRTASIFGRSILINPAAFNFSVDSENNVPATTKQISTTSNNTSKKLDSPQLANNSQFPVPAQSNTHRPPNPLYHQLVNESRAKINAYMRSNASASNSNSPSVTILDSRQPAATLFPIRANSFNVASHMGPSKSQDFTSNGNDSSLESALNPIDGLLTPKKRSNSITGAREIIEPTQASPTFRTNHASELDRLTNLPQRLQSLHTSTAAAPEPRRQYSSNPFAELNASGGSDTNGVEARPEKSDPLLKPFTPYPSSVYVSPVGSAIQDLSVTSPNYRKRQSSEGAQPERSWNKRPNQSPMVSKIINRNPERSVSNAPNFVDSTGKAKFDPSKIDVADIIELD